MNSITLEEHCSYRALVDATLLFLEEVSGTKRLRWELCCLYCPKKRMDNLETIFSAFTFMCHQDRTFHNIVNLLLAFIFSPWIMTYSLSRALNTNFWKQESASVNLLQLLVSIKTSFVSDIIHNTFVSLYSLDSVYLQFDISSFTLV